MNKITAIVLKVIGGIALFAAAFFLLGYITMHLWNWLMPELFHLPVINFYQAIGLVVLSKILLGWIRIHTGPFGQRKLWKAKWESMSADERNEFRTEFAARCKAKWGKDQPEPKATN